MSTEQAKRKQRKKQKRKQKQQQKQKQAEGQQRQSMPEDDNKLDEIEVKDVFPMTTQIQSTWTNITASVSKPQLLPIVSTSNNNST